MTKESDCGMTPSGNVNAVVALNYPRPKIKVTIYLRGNQRLDLNKWKCTIQGEERVVTVRTVVWFVFTRQEAIESFSMDEIDSFSITFRNEYGQGSVPVEKFPPVTEY